MKKFTLIILSSFLLFTACASTSKNYTQKQFTLQGHHGKLSGVLQTPKGKKTYPLVIILHGFNASKKMYLMADLARQLNQRGIATILFDFNGQGQSEGSFLDMTIPNELEDAKRVLAYAESLPKVQSVSAVGHSQGGVIAGMLAGEVGADKIKTIVLMAPAPELKQDTARGNLFGVNYDVNNIPPYITLANGLKVGRAYLETTKDLPIYEVSSQYKGPVFVIHSQDDDLVPYKYGAEYCKIFTDCKLETLHGLDHCFTQDTPAVNKIIADFFEQELINKK